MKASNLLISVSNSPTVTEPGGLKVRHFLRCPCCGRATGHYAFTRGALGFALQATKQTFVGHRNGDNNGAVIWTRRPMNRDELERVGRSVATASTAITKALDEDFPDVESCEELFASIDSGVEFDAVTADWIKEAEDELVWRQRVVQEAYESRGEIDGKYGR